MTNMTNMRGAVAMAAASVFLFHFMVTCLYLTPLNPVKLRLSGFVNSYMNTLFKQNWHLFAPNPISQSMSLLGRCRIQGKDTPWIDITDSILDSLRSNRFDATASAHAHTQLNLIRMVTSGVSFHEPILAAHCTDEPDDDFCQHRQELAEDARKHGMEMLKWLVANVCRELGDARPEMVSIRIARLVFPRFSQRHMKDLDGDLSFVDFGWHEAP